MPRTLKRYTLRETGRAVKEYTIEAHSKAEAKRRAMEGHESMDGTGYEEVLGSNRFTVIGDAEEL